MSGPRSTASPDGYGLRESITRQWFWINNPDDPRFDDLGMSPGSSDRRDAEFDMWLRDQVLLHVGSRELAKGRHAGDGCSNAGAATTGADGGGVPWTEMGWQPETVLGLAERFIEDRRLKDAYESYLQVVAEEEQGMSAEDGEDP